MCIPALEGPLSLVSLKLLLQDKVADLGFGDVLVLGAAKSFFSFQLFWAHKDQMLPVAPSPGGGSV